MLQPLVRRTWAERGKPPKLKAWDRHDRLTAMAAITLSPDHRKMGMYFRIQRDNAKAKDFLLFLLELHKQLKTRIIVVWDRLSAHRSAEKFFRVCECPWLSIEYLPSYSPELNPVEHIWSITKWGRLANWPAPDIDQLHERITNELTTQSKNPNQLRRHFDWAKLKTTNIISSRRRQ